MESTEAGGGDGPIIGPCRNAEEYALRVLESRDGTVSPGELAEEYGCTPGHMQDVLRESEETVRVEIGEYALSTEESTGDEDTLTSVEPADKAGFEALEAARDVDTGTERPSAGGGPQLEAPGGTDGDQEEGEEQEGNEEGGAVEAVDVTDATDAAGGGEGIDESGGEMPGIPVPVSSTTLVVAVGVLVFAVLVFQYVRGGTEGEQNDENQQNQQVEPAANSLVEGY
jgi:hypothetical protein